MSSLGGKKPDNRCLKPIVVKFENFNQEELVKSCGLELKGKTLASATNSLRRSLIATEFYFLSKKKFMKEDLGLDKLYVNN